MSFKIPHSLDGFSSFKLEKKWSHSFPHCQCLGDIFVFEMPLFPFMTHGSFEWRSDFWSRCMFQSFHSVSFLYSRTSSTTYGCQSSSRKLNPFFFVFLPLCTCTWWPILIPLMTSPVFVFLGFSNVFATSSLEIRS